MIGPRLSIVTTCKGRLHHLLRSLPSFLAQPDCEVIVVDYDCPDDTAGFCARTFPAVRVVKVKDAPDFNAARARNFGADAASGEWIAFFDADIVMAADFVRRLGPALEQHGAFHRFLGTDLRTYPATGSFVLRRADFIAIDRYDDVMQDYGGEDQDLYFRLVLFGLTPQPMDFDMLAEIIHHPDGDRVRFGRYDTVGRSLQVNDVYYVVKHSLLRHVGVNGLDTAQRRTLYALIRDVVNDSGRTPETPIHFTMELPRDPAGMNTHGWTVRRQLVFDLAPDIAAIQKRAERADAYLDMTR